VKRATGIPGFDEMSQGGLPEARLTAVMGAPGAGKTVFALQTVVNRATATGEACIFVSFEEPPESVKGNAASFAWNFGPELDERVHFIDARLPDNIAISGDFDLSGLLASLSALTAKTGARTVVLDALDMLLGLLRDEQLERRELLRLDAWIRDVGLSAIITVKSFGLGERDLRRADFLQYMTDCVVVLECEVTETSASRSLRIAKYRGSSFAPNPAPYVIGAGGIEIVILKGSRLSYPTFHERISTGVARLDGLLNGGYLKGSSTLISGSPGTSKTSLAASFALSVCRAGGRVLFVSFDESGEHISANMGSIGLSLGDYTQSGHLAFQSLLSGSRSPETHFLAIRAAFDRHRPDALIIDPVSALLKGDYAFGSMIGEALLDHSKSRGVTVLCTSLLGEVSGNVEMSASHISTMADTWIHVSYLAREGERNRALTIVKSRGTNHSNQVRELILSKDGISLTDVYIDEGEVLMGSARAQKQAEVARLAFLADIEAKRRRRDLDRELAELQTRVRMATLEFEAKQQEIESLSATETAVGALDRAAEAQRLDLRRANDDATKGVPA
jgi:circadian clock protein KaiC